MIMPPAYIASFAAAAVTTAGLLVVQRHREWGLRNSVYFACFAAGVLIVVCFLHLLPKTVALSPAAPALLLTGYIVMHAFNRFVTAQVCDKPATADYAIGLVPLMGIGFHSFVDGAIYSVTFTVDLFTGISTAVGMVLHEFPEGIVTYVLLLRGGFSARWAFWLAFAAAAVSTPLGTLVSHGWISKVTPAQLGNLLAVSAGALFYVGATHLLPISQREPRKLSFMALLAGMATACGIVFTAA